MPNSSVFELLITGADEARRYVAYVPDGNGGRAAEQTFEWRVDSTALALELGQLARRTPLRLALRLDPGKAGPLRNLPWEYLHDGEGFLALDLRTPLTRLA